MTVPEPFGNEAQGLYFVDLSCKEMSSENVNSNTLSSSIWSKCNKSLAVQGAQISKPLHTACFSDSLEL